MWIPNPATTIVTGVAAGAGLVCLYKDYRSGPRYPKDVSARGKTVIVTGANDGIGKETAWEFANRGAKVFMACRDMERCETARRQIVMETENKFVYCRPCDLASLESVREFVQRFKSEEPYLDILVNNAAVMAPPRGFTREGFETQFGVNHLGHFLLTNLLLDTLKESSPSRVVVLTAAAHARGTINKEDLNWSKEYDGMKAYYQSKLANVLFVKELARHLADKDVAVSAVDPGHVDTDLPRHLPMSKSITRFFIYPLFWPTMKNVRMGAQPVLHAALDEKTAKSKGEYYRNMEPVEPSEEGQDFELALWLWKVSERWTKLDEHKAILKKNLSANQTK